MINSLILEQRRSYFAEVWPFDSVVYTTMENELTSFARVF